MYASDESAGFITTPLGVPPRLMLFGVTGAKYRVDYVDEFGIGSPTAWQSSPSFTLTTTPYTWTNGSATNVPRRFYRTVLLP
jgi:hypothetical protein